MRQSESVVVAEHGENAVLARKLNHGLGIRALGDQIAREDNSVALGVTALP